MNFINAKYLIPLPVIIGALFLITPPGMNFLAQWVRFELQGEPTHIDTLFAEKKIAIEEKNDQKILNLSRLNLASLKGLDSLPSIDKVSTIDLSHNDLNSLDEIDFKKLKSLTALIARNNNITALKTEGLSFCKKLHFIDLGHNHLASIEPFKARAFPCLKTLILTNNQFNSLEGIKFNFLSELEFLDISHNKLSTLKGLEYITNVETVDLSHNALTAFDNDVMKTWESVLNLNFNNNELTSLTGLPIMKQLFALEAASNKIDNVSYDFSGFMHLIWLDLNNNQISNISSFESLGKLDNMVRLDITGNIINNYSPLQALYRKKESTGIKCVIHADQKVSFK